MDVKTVKGITNEEWIKFKMLAAKKSVPLGVLFKMMLDDYSKKGDFLWNKILKIERIISDKEAEELEEVVKSLRKERGYRE